MAPSPLPLPSPPLTPVVRAAALGDELAWAALMQRFTPVLRRVAKGYRLAPHEVDDVVQGCWIALLENLDRVREPEAVGAWLITAARRKALRARQREVREVLTDEPVPEQRTASDCVATSAEQHELAGELWRAVEQLPGRQRELISSLLRTPDPSYAELSRRLSMPVGSIGPTRERALDRLRRDRRLAAASGRAA